MKVTNKELVQSYILTTAKYDFSVHEKRILYRIVETFQDQFEGRKLNTEFQMRTDGNLTVTMPVKSFLADEKSKNHDCVKKAFTALRNKAFEYETEEVWQYIGIVEMPKFDKKGEKVTFLIQPQVVDALSSFAKGYRTYELNTAFMFESVYAMRFYELFSKQDGGIIQYSIDKLKEIFGIENKYNGRPSDFIKRVIIPSKEELDAKSPYSFDYSPIKTGRKITSLMFFPKRIEANQSSISNDKTTLVPVDWVLPSVIKTLLKSECSFTDREIKNNMETFERASKVFANTSEYFEFIESKHKASEGMDERKGYVIAALKGETASRYAKNTISSSSSASLPPKESGSSQPYLDKITEESKRISQELAQYYDEQRKKEQS